MPWVIPFLGKRGQLWFCSWLLFCWAHHKTLWNLCWTELKTHSLPGFYSITGLCCYIFRMHEPVCGKAQTISRLEYISIYVLSLLINNLCLGSSAFAKRATYVTNLMQRIILMKIHGIAKHPPNIPLNVSLGPWKWSYFTGYSFIHSP